MNLDKQPPTSRRKAIKRGLASAVDMATIPILGQSQPARTPSLSPSPKMRLINNPYTLWAANVSGRSIDEKIRVAQAGNFSKISLFPSDVAQAENEGLSLKALREKLERNGISVTTLDPFTRWLPEWNPPDTFDKQMTEFLGTDEDTFFRMAEALQVTSISVIEVFNMKFPPEVWVTSFQRICDKAADRGLNVQLEFMPWGTSSVDSLAKAWRIVQAADRDNGGLMFDTWCYLNSERNDELLRQISAQKVFQVQLASANDSLQGNTMLHEAMHHRRRLGSGNDELRSVVKTLQASGKLNEVGIEVFSDDFAQRDAAELGSQLAQDLTQFMQEL